MYCCQNISIQGLNTQTGEFYEHQTRYNSSQKLLTVAIFFTGAVSAIIATCQYFKPTTNSTTYIVIDTVSHNQRLLKLESNMKFQTNRFDTLEKIVKDSLELKP